MYIDHSIPKFWVEYLNKILEISKTRSYNLTSKSNKIAVLIEPREHFLLESVFHNFLYRLADKEWMFCIVHGQSNKEFVSNIVKEIKGVYLYPLQVDNLPIPEYNKLLTSSNFWKTIPTDAEHILIFQTDTILLKNNIDDFLNYDYIGAPWHIANKNTIVGGNGGLSTRKRSKMIEICDKKGITATNEDLYFCHYSPLNLPTFENALKFSVENVYYCNPMGMHKSYGLLNHLLIKQLLKLPSNPSNLENTSNPVNTSNANNPSQGKNNSKKILNAKYGHGNKFIDVTDKIIDFINIKQDLQIQIMVLLKI